jgi:hypothetical protein
MYTSVATAWFKVYDRYTRLSKPLFLSTTRLPSVVYIEWSGPMMNE